MSLSRPVLWVLLAVAGLIVVYGLYVLLWVTVYVRPVAVPTTPRQWQTLGSGPALRYVVLGDSTSVSQGGDYQRGYAVATAGSLAETHTVTWRNVGVSGARSADVLHKQLPQIIDQAPDVVLIGIGANDAMHRTNLAAVANSLRQTIQQLQAANPEVRIVLTGSPDMGSALGIPVPYRQIVSRRAAQVNERIMPLADGQRVVFAPIAKVTGPIFRAHPEYFARDHFHPNTKGYDQWTAVLVPVLRQLDLPK